MATAVAAAFSQLFFFFFLQFKIALKRLFIECLGERVKKKKKEGKDDTVWFCTAINYCEVFGQNMKKKTVVTKREREGKAGLVCAVKLAVNEEVFFFFL